MYYVARILMSCDVHRDTETGGIIVIIHIIPEKQ